MTAKAVMKAAKRAGKAAVAGAVLAAAVASAAMPSTSAGATPGLVSFRKYQQRVFWDHTTKTQILHWSRQIGKSYTLAGWGVDRLLRFPGRLVTVLSNSRANGSEFVLKCQEVCQKLGKAIEIESNQAQLDGRSDLSEDMKFDMMRFEVRITVEGKTGRILVLAANPRTARGFSGDLILDEFAFHEDSRAIWEAAEPIISSNPDFLCRISSTGNGKRNMFYQLISEGRIPYYRVRRSDAWNAGEIKIYSAIDGKEITPAEARAQASDKRAYDQNYECKFNDENTALLTQELISRAERDGILIEEQRWSDASIYRMSKCEGLLFAGQDVGRNRDLSVLTVVEKIGQQLRVVGMLRMENTRLPKQQAQLERILALPNFRRIEIDMTGIGLGLVEYAQDHKLGGLNRVAGVNFGSSEPITKKLKADGKKAEKARVTEIMATEMLGVFEEGRIEIPAEAGLRDSLRKPEKITSPGGQVSIAATRDDAGHADEFWSIALAIRASSRKGAPPPPPRRNHREGISARASRGFRSRRNRSLPG